jgi:hypothetical protein
VANTPVSATIPTVVFTPPAYGVPHAVLYNQGPATVYLGGSGVSTQTGVALGPNDKIRWPVANAGTIYSISGYNQISPAGTIATATALPAGTVITMTAGGTFFTAGMWIAIESGTPRQEIQQVNGSNAGSIFTNGPLTYMHGTAVTIWQVSPVPSVVFTGQVGAT